MWGAEKHVYAGVFTWNLFLCVFTWNLFCACSHGTFCDSFDHYLQSLLPGVRRARGTSLAGLSSDMLPGYFRVTDEEFSLLFLFVCYHYATTKGLVHLSKEDVNLPTQKTRWD